MDTWKGAGLQVENTNLARVYNSPNAEIFTCYQCQPVPGAKVGVPAETARGSWLVSRHQTLDLKFVFELLIYIILDIEVFNRNRQEKKELGIK